MYSAPIVVRLSNCTGDGYVTSDAIGEHLWVVGSVGEPLAANAWAGSVYMTSLDGAKSMSWTHSPDILSHSDRIVSDCTTG